MIALRLWPLLLVAACEASDGYNTKMRTVARVDTASVVCPVLFTDGTIRASSQYCILRTGDSVRTFP